MISNRNQLNDWLVYEKSKYKINRFSYFRLFMGCENAILWSFQRRLRITEFHFNARHKFRYLFNLFLLNRLRNKYCLRIELNVFDKGLKIMHLGPILTNGKVKVGKDCAIHINVALVAQGKNDGCPRIGNNVVIGTGSTLLGDIIIADGIAVGANALVNRSFVEENIAIAGVPAKKISNNGRNAWNKKC